MNKAKTRIARGEKQISEIENNENKSLVDNKLVDTQTVILSYG